MFDQASFVAPRDLKKYSGKKNIDVECGPMQVDEVYACVVLSTRLDDYKLEAN
jgi:hypothetical protein